MKMSDDAVIRAIERAKKDNLQIEYDTTKDIYWVESTSEPGRLHKVYYKPRLLCDCTGFWRNGSICKHSALTLLEAIKANKIWVCDNCFEILPLPLSPDIFARHTNKECQAPCAGTLNES